MSKKLKYVGIVVITLAVIITVGLIVKDKYFDKALSVVSIYDEGNDESAIYVNSKLVGKVAGEAVIENNIDNSAYYVVSAKEIQLLENKKLQKVGEKLIFLSMANFSTEALVMDENNVLYIYRDGKLEKITDKDICMATISGDGQYYSYSTDDGAYYGSEPGKEIEVVDVMIPYISNNGQLVYGLKYDEEGKKELDKKYGRFYIDAFSSTESFYISSGFQLLSVNEDGSTDIIKDDVIGIYGLNSAGNEILFYNEEGTYISLNCKEAKQVEAGIVYSLYYYDDENSWNDNYYAINSFKNAVCQVKYISNNGQNSSICKITSDYGMEKIVGDCYEFVGINDSMKLVFYIDGNGDLYRAETKKDAKSELLAEDVEVVRISPDGKDVYFTRNGDENITILYHIENGLKEKELAWVYDFFDIIVYNNYCYLQSRDMYYIKDDTVTKMDELGDLNNFFIDYITQTAYGYDDNYVYEIDGEDKKTLEGKYKEITSANIAY